MPNSSIAPWTVHPARFGALLTLIAGLCAAALPPAAQAQTPNEFLVDSVLDQPDVELVDDICDADPGRGAVYVARRGDAGERDARRACHPTAAGCSIA